MIFKDIAFFSSGPGNPVPSWEFNLHSHVHQDYQLYYFIQWKGNITVERTSYTISGGSAVLTFPYEKTRLHLGPAFDAYFYRVIFILEPEDSGFKEFLSEVFLHARVFQVPKNTRFFIEQIKKNISSSRSYMLTAASHQLKGFFYECTSVFDTTVHTPLHNVHVDKALKIMDRNLNEKLTLSKLARELNISEEYLIRLFKKITGMSPMKYYNRLKIEKATSLLTQDNLPVHVVAAQLEFASESHFSRSFKKFMQLSPSDYRTGYIRLLEMRNQYSREELSVANEFIQNLIDSTPDLIFYKDTNGTIIGCNKAFSELMGLPKERIVGQGDYDLFPEEMARFFYDRDQTVIRHKKPATNTEWMYYANGRKRLFEVTKAPYFDSQGNVRGIIGISRDVTDRVKVTHTRS